jgi:hypothetical protein
MMKTTNREERTMAFAESGIDESGGAFVADVVVVGEPGVHPEAVAIGDIGQRSPFVAVLVAPEASVEFSLARLKKVGAAKVVLVDPNVGEVVEAVEKAVVAARLGMDPRQPSASLLRAAKACSVRFDPKLLGEAGVMVERLARLAGAPAEFSMAALLATVSGLASGRFIASVRPGFEVTLILWLANVGDASSGKSPALDLVLKPLRKFEADAQRHRREEIKALVDQGEKPKDAARKVPPATRALVSNASIEALQHLAAEQGRALIAAYDELSEWFAGLTRYSKSAQGDRGTWLSAHNCYPLVVDRRSLDEPLRIDHWGVSLVGGIPPSVLSSLARSAELESEDGMDVRLLYLRPVLPPVALRPQEGDDAAIADLERMMLRIIAWRREACGTEPIAFDDKAKERFEKWRFNLLNNARNGKKEVGAWVGKLPGLVVRLCGVLAVIDAAMAGNVPPKAITVNHLSRAAKLADLFSAHRRRIVLERGAVATEALAAELASFILENRVTSLNSFELRKGLIPGIRNEKTLRAVLREMHAAGWLAGWVTYKPDEPLPPVILIKPEVFDLDGGANA